MPPKPAQTLNLVLLAALIVLLPSCKYFNEKSLVKNEVTIARVGDDYLYQSDIEHIARNAASSGDSASVVEKYVEDWVKRKLMIEKANQYLPREKLDIDRQVEDYRESLVLYIYEKELILQKLDTVVEENILIDYFDEYKTNFELKNDIAQLLFVKSPKDAPKIDSLILWIASKQEEANRKLEDYCHQYAVDFSIGDTVWFETSSIYSNIPISAHQLEMLKVYKNTVMVSDSLFNYVVKVTGSKNKGEIAPYHFVKDDITRIILNKRKKELVRSTFENVYLEGKRSNKIQIYE